MSWNPQTYLAFADERTRPAAELLARVQSSNPARVADLGCGPGNSTAPLRARWPNADIDGIDSSVEMLDQARKSGILANWILADLSSWAPRAPYDVIFSNATFQWLPAHEKLLSRLIGYVDASGTLAFQAPNNMQAPSHVLMRDTAAQDRFAQKLKGVREIAVLPVVAYYDILKPFCASVDIWETEYLHVLKGEDAIYHWVSATGLRPFLQALAEGDRAAFVDNYKRRLNAAYPRRADGTTLFAFRRLFVVARRSALSTPLKADVPMVD